MESFQVSAEFEVVSIQTKLEVEADWWRRK